MKIRSGFVSNSSSSSFILASDKQLDEMTITVTFKLGSIVEETLKTKDDVYRYAFNRWVWGDKSLEETFQKDPDSKSMYEAALKAIEEGKTVFTGSSSNVGYGIAEQMLFDQGFSEQNEDLIVIEEINYWGL